jgi:hypothetical protein
MKVNMAVVKRAGLIGGAAGLVFGILVGLIPALKCIIWWIGPLIALVTGALYVHFSAGKVELAEGALGGALVGAIPSGISGFVSNLLLAIFYDGSFVSVITGLIGGIIGGAIAGAIGGLVYSLIKK